jgi:hypothetical protein
MARRDSFDDGHGMDHHRAINKAIRLGAGAVMGAGLIGGPVGALAGAAAFHVVDKVYDSRKSQDEEEDY